MHPNPHPRKEKSCIDGKSVAGPGLGNHRVSIEAETKQESEKKEGGRVIYAERSARRFARSFTLPFEVDDANAQAKFENGVLTLNLPKKAPAHAKTLSIQ